MARRVGGEGRSKTALVPPPFLRITLCATLSLLLGVPAAAGDIFERLQSTWLGLHEYSVTIVAHEVMGEQTDEHQLFYEFQKPNHARLDVVEGTKSGSVILWNGGDRVTAYRKNMSFFKIHGGVRDHDLTSLRGNGILNPNMGDVLACYGEHRSELREREGPAIDGDATDEVELPYTSVTCPDDPPTDREITADVIDVSKKTGLVLMRKRYVGDEVVERWELKDYRIDTGLIEAMR